MREKSENIRELKEVFLFSLNRGNVLILILSSRFRSCSLVAAIVQKKNDLKAIKFHSEL